MNRLIILAAIVLVSALGGCHSANDRCCSARSNGIASAVAAEASEPILRIDVTEGDERACRRSDPVARSATHATPSSHRRRAEARRAEAALAELRHGTRIETIDAARATLAGAQSTAGQRASRARSSRRDPQARPDRAGRSRQRRNRVAHRHGADATTRARISPSYSTARASRISIRPKPRSPARRRAVEHLTTDARASRRARAARWPRRRAAVQARRSAAARRDAGQHAFRSRAVCAHLRAREPARATRAGRALPRAM